MGFLIGLLATLPSQPPTAPAPREGVIYNLTWTYTGLEAAKTSVLEMGVKDGRVEARWKSGKSFYTAIAAKVVVRDGVLSLVGTEKEPAVLTEAAGAVSALRIDVVLESGTVTAWGAIGPKRAP